MFYTDERREGERRKGMPILNDISTSTEGDVPSKSIQVDVCVYIHLKGKSTLILM